MFIYHKILVALFTGGDGLSLEMILLLNFIPSLYDISSFHGVIHSRKIIQEKLYSFKK